MRRRAFLSTGGAALAAILSPRLSRSAPARRAAVVIGVDQAGDLPRLRAAASGASAFANWLTLERFEVTCFTDGPGAPVKVDPVFDAVDAIVRSGTCEQLVVYFSGHGFLNSYRELWMLSGAPNNPNQAISLLECERLCKRTGIPNVVFISDACRSTASSLAADSVRGSVIFPTAASAGDVTTKVDVFLATQEGDPAYEVGVDEATRNFHGIFTESFLQAFRSPEDDMISVVDGVEVILNRDLEGWLRRDVDRRAQLASLSLSQRPESSVLSDRYIGRVRRSGTSAAALPPTEPTINEAAAWILAERGFQALAAPYSSPPSTIRSSDKARDFESAQRTIAQAEASAPRSFETQTGFFVSGAVVDEVVTNPAFYGAERVPGAIRLVPRDGRPASAAIRFADGSGTVVAALRGYIGTVVVDDGRVVSVSYTRSGGGGSSEEERLQELRRLVATSARFGTFNISGTGEERERRAEELANTIRALKRIDPTLGIYAAYAYDDADLPGQVESVWEFMRHDIEGQIFDVALLAGVLRDVAPDAREGIAPFCPMLSQGWGLLRIANVQLLPEVDTARDHMVPALWTTFRPRGMELVIDALRRGRVV